MVSRDQMNPLVYGALQKYKETRNKILAQVNIKDSGKRDNLYLISYYSTFAKSRIKTSINNFLPESLVFTHVRILFLVFLCIWRVD